jgi:hypothetical protein
MKAESYSSLIVFETISDVLEPDTLNRDACPSANAIARAWIQHVVVSVAPIKTCSIPERTRKIKVEPNRC